MKDFVIWSHYTPKSRSAAGQRLKAFAHAIHESGSSYKLVGGGFDSTKATWWRLLIEVFTIVLSPARIYILSLPPYRSAIVQILLLPLLRKTIVIDQRDIVLERDNRLDLWLERRAITSACALIVTSHAQHRVMRHRYGTRLPKVYLVRNGASDDLISASSRKAANISERRPHVFYQGLVGGKKLAPIAGRLSALGCDFTLAVFMDRYSQAELAQIRSHWVGAGDLTIYANLDAQDLSKVMDQCDIALNPVPEHMEYAFTVKTADYAVRGIPQLVIGGERSVTVRSVRLCHLGTSIAKLDQLDNSALERTLDNFQYPSSTRVFERTTHLEAFKLVIRTLLPIP